MLLPAPHTCPPAGRYMHGAAPHTYAPKGAWTHGDLKRNWRKVEAWVPPQAVASK